MPLIDGKEAAFLCHLASMRHLFAVDV